MAANLWVQDGWVEEGWVYSGIFIDPATNIIFVPQSFLTLVSGVLYELDTNAFRIALRDLEDDEKGIVMPKTHNHNTSVTLGGIEYARVIEILAPYTVQFEETGTPYTVSLKGSNNNILERTNLGTVQIQSNNSAGLINLTELQYGAYDDGVTYDPTSANSGTSYPTYSQLQPGNDLTEAEQVADARGFENIYLKNNLTVEANETISGYHIHGRGATVNIAESTLTYVSGCSTHKAHIYDCLVTGVQGGENYYTDCIIDQLESFHCVFTRCGFKDGTNTTGGWTIKQSQGPSAGHVTYFKDCYSDEGEFIIDRDGAKPTMLFDGFHGNIKFINMNEPTVGDVHLHMNGGHVHIDATCTTGTIHITGDFELDNQSSGTTVHTEANPRIKETHQRLGLDPDAPVTNNTDGSYSFTGATVGATADGGGNVTHQRTP